MLLLADSDGDCASHCGGRQESVLNIGLDGDEKFKKQDRGWWHNERFIVNRIPGRSALSLTTLY